MRHLCPFNPTVNDHDHGNKFKKHIIYARRGDLIRWLALLDLLFKNFRKIKRNHQDDDTNMDIDKIVFVNFFTGNHFTGCVSSLVKMNTITMSDEFKFEVMKVNF